MNSLKLAFRDEIRPDEFMGRVWLTATVIIITLSVMTVVPTGQQADINNLLPMGNWHPRNPGGAAYIELWATILVNASQISFGIWGGILLLTGVKRLITSNKFVFGCLFLGMCFIGIAVALPSCVQPLLQIAVNQYPVLMQ